MQNQARNNETTRNESQSHYFPPPPSHGEREAPPKIFRTNSRRFEQLSTNDDQLHRCSLARVNQTNTIERTTLKDHIRFSKHPDRSFDQQRREEPSVHRYRFLSLFFFFLIILSPLSFFY